ncbi:tRNA adenosine deaminase [Propioniciclava sinopodophylli]|uniref:tRNA adenosine deaminase n=1 Tax=Propioniciclava sinopodophylli TaxID=1837344 RepID=A0A4Q9KD97_9ACTN|nr:tRNA adenosine deaminase-associated protein [Propioniciclava sinopodophylli]TBT83321.1 tRNA adenosine deaminase [Propioniciclava sinopodophylli]
MAGRDEEFDAELADRGDDRPGIDEADENDYSALDLLDPEADDANDDDDDTDEDDYDYPEDATEDDIDLVAALYREDGQPAATALDLELANDLDGLIEALRRVPGDAGAVGVVSIDSDFFVIVRVRGPKVELFLSDVSAALDWPIARDAADFLGVDLPDDDDDSEPVGDFDLFADAGLSEMELEAITTDDDADPLESLEAIVDKLGFAGVYDKVASGFGLEG